LTTLLEKTPRASYSSKKEKNRLSGKGKGKRKGQRQSSSEGRKSIWSNLANRVVSEYSGRGI